MRYRLRTLMIRMTVVPPLMAGAWWLMMPEIENAYNSWLWQREIDEYEAKVLRAVQAK